MDTTIGTSQASLAITRTTSSNANNVFYITKFISKPLNQASIAANTWTWNFAVKASLVGSTGCEDYPSNNVNDKIPIYVYVWRPSTGTKIGSISTDTIQPNARDTANVYYDVGNGSLQIPGGTTAESAEHGTFAGSAVTCAVGDVIIVEAWTTINTNSASSLTCTFYYDGTTVTTTNGPTVSSQAAFLETPENLSFVTSSNKTKTLTETITIGQPTPVRIKSANKANAETVTISSPAPARLAAKKRALATETITISTDPGSPSIIKAKNVSKTLTETVTVGQPTPTRIKGSVKAINQTIAIAENLTYIQHPKRARMTLTENVIINSTTTRITSKRRTLLN